MDFTFSATNEVTKSSSVVSSGGARGLQVLAVVNPLDENEPTNTVSLIVLAIAEDNDEIGQEYFRFEGFDGDATSLGILYPGVEEGPLTYGSQFNGVLPSKFQLMAINAQGLGMNATFHVTLLP